MTKDDKILLLHFVTRTGMYIFPVDIHNIQSFITGYEIGRKNKCKFYDLSKDLLLTKHKVKYLSDGWLGQIKRLSEKKAFSNVVTFKRVALDTIAANGLDNKMKEIIKSGIIALINKIEKAGHPWYNETWKDDWQSLVLVDKNWTKELFGKEQWEVIKLLDKEILANNIFKDNGNKIPSDSILKLKYQFDQ
jgi:hypothetical protein